MKYAEEMKIVFTSFRDSLDETGLKLSIDKHTPKACSYPTLTYLVIPMAAKSLTKDNMERICEAVLDNNWHLIQEFITESYEQQGTRKLVLCDWATAEQISNGQPCTAEVIGRYIHREVLNGQFEFPVEIEYKDGRAIL